MPTPVHVYTSCMQRKLDLLEAKAYELAGSEFALNSPQQLREVCGFYWQFYASLYTLLNKQRFPCLVYYLMQIANRYCMIACNWTRSCRHAK